MHARNRSPGNGYRGNAMGMSGATIASRISAESSMRGNGRGYSSEYKSYSRGGFARGQSRHFNRPQVPPVPPQKGGDIFMEAGKLAAEYLIAKGLLPANVLSGKWQNGSLKDLVVGSQGGEHVEHSLDGRASALSRLGGTGGDVGSGRRRYTDDHTSMGSRSSSRDRRRNGSFKYDGRELGRSASLSEQSKASADREDDNDVVSRHQDEWQVSNEGDSLSQSSIPELRPESGVAAQESEIAGHPRSALEKFESTDKAGARENACSSEGDLLLKTGEEAVQKDDKKVANLEGEKNKHGGKIDEMVLQDAKYVMASSEDRSLASRKSTDLLKLCCFAKVPTRTRSSMVFRGFKADPDPMIVDNNSSEGEPPKDSRAHVEDSSDNLSGNGVPYQKNDSNPRVLAAEDELDPSHALARGSCYAPVSSPDKCSENEWETPDFGMTNSVVALRGEKRGLDEGNPCTDPMGSKKPRESTPEDVEPNSHLSLLGPLVKRPMLEEPMTSEGRAIILPSDENRLLDISLYAKGDVEPCMEFTQEKQLLPGSFKTCDLNLMEASEANENQDIDPILMFPSVRENGKQGGPIDIDLSMRNNPRVSTRFGKCNVDGKDIEVIDLENDSGQEDKDSNNLDGRTENVFTGLSGYSNAPNANEIADAPDGYGLMISELMGNDIPNCSSVPADVDSLHNDMGLVNGEGILGDDDSIYMSLGEIPLSFLRAWEQPSQEYGKPF